ncbi:MAG TPA: hypothetical protein VGF74_07070 [Thermoleophilaceae bacterium]
MHRRWMAGLALPVLLAAGCGGGSHQTSTPRPTQAAARPGDEKVIRGWNRAINGRDYETAASYFAQGAVVTQDYVLQLRSHKFAVEWNSGLPCRADITFIRAERVTSVAGFHLRKGPHGACKGGGSARVRFTIRNGLIQRWQQLLTPPDQQQTQVPAT